MQCVFNGFPLWHVMSGIAQTMLGWCKCTLTYRLFLVLPSYEWKKHFRALERRTSVARQTVRLPVRIDVSHQKYNLFEYFLYCNYVVQQSFKTYGLLEEYWCHMYMSENRWRIEVTCGQYNNPPAIASFVYWNYCYKAVDIQIPYDAGWASIPYTVRKFLHYLALCAVL